MGSQDTVSSGDNSQIVRVGEGKWDVSWEPGGCFEFVMQEIANRLKVEDV